MKEDQLNKVYEDQFLLLAFVTIVTFKVVMLPQYFVKAASNNGYMIMAFLVIVEMMMMAVVYGITKHGSLLQLDVPKWLKGVFAILVFSSSFIKSTVLGSEGVSYISTSIYDNVSWIFITLALLATCTYLAHKGGKVIARSTQIFFWIMTFALLFFAMFSNVNLNILNLMPFKISGELAVAGDRYLMWFGDFTPLLFIHVCKSPNRKKYRLALWTVLTVIGTLVCTVGLMILFTCTFGGAGELIGNAFINISSLNKISFMIGSADLPTVLAWMVMCVTKFSLLLYAMTECAKFFFGNRALVAAICGAVVCVVICYVIGNLNTNYKWATSWLRYYAFFAEFCVTIAAYIALRISQRKKEKTMPQNKEAQNAQADTSAAQSIQGGNA